MRSKNFKYQFEEHTIPKGDCPNCKSKKCFRYYANLPRAFGICDKKNNCGYHNKPNKQKLIDMDYIEDQNIIEPKKASVKIIYPSANNCKEIIANQTSVFHLFAIKTGLTSDHLQKWNCGTAENKTGFAYQNSNKTFVNIVHIEYAENGKRNKNKTPYSLKAKSGEKYSLCLYGEHLLCDKIVCLVESEKTAIFASFFYPQFDWLATGGANKLTDEKISVLFGRKIYYLNDADKAGKENSTIKKLIAYKQNFEIIDLFRERNDGYDIADAICDGVFLEIKSNVKINEQDIIASAPKSKNMSVFDKVEQFLAERYEMRYNIVSNEIENRSNDEKGAYQMLNENDIYIEIQKSFIKFSQANVRAMLGSKYVSKYNPFTEYFESLGEWTFDETDYIEKVCTYIPVGENDIERLHIQLKKMLVRCIACALTDGVFNKQAFILVHDEQNTGKSTLCRWFCPPSLSEYIAENISTDKDSLICLSENFIINMDELSTLNKTEINALKAMMSKPVVKVRRPYDRKPCLTQRRANFVGNTNRGEFLNDETGSVRWICFELVDKINFDYNKYVNIDDVWKQAYTLFKQGFKYELTPREIAENEVANKTFQITSEEQELIQKNYSPATKEKHNVFYQATDIRLALLEKYPAIRLNKIMIGKAMKSLGFKQEQKVKDGMDYQVKGYYVNFIYK